MAKELLEIESEEEHQKIKLEIDTQIYSTLFKLYIENFEWYQLLFLYYMSNDVFSKNEIFDVILEKIIEKFEIEYNSERVKLPQSGGYTPLGLTDTTWQPYYKILIVIGLIGKYTKESSQFNKIKTLLETSTIFETDDVYAIKSVKFNLKQNSLFGEQIINCETENKLYVRHTLHSNEKEFNQYTQDRISELINIYNKTEKQQIKKVCAYMLNTYVNTSYNWMKNLYNYRKEETQSIVSIELSL